MDEKNLKEVYFDRYCRSCEHWDKKDWDDPCNECLGTPANVNSHKPVNYKEKGK